MINFSVVEKINPTDKNKPIRCYAAVQQTETMTIDDLAKHMIEHGSVFKRGDIVGIITNMVDCLKEMLLNGNRVQLGELGSFAPSVTSKPADFEDEFTAKNITEVSSNWDKGEAFKNMRSEASFKKVQTIAVQAAVESAKKEGTTINPSEIGGVQKPTFSVTSAPIAGCEKMGTVEGRGKYVEGATAVVTAVANPGFTFTGWDDGVGSDTRHATTNFSAKAKFAVLVAPGTGDDPSAD